jgi:hypothetical protein
MSNDGALESDITNSSFNRVIERWEFSASYIVKFLSISYGISLVPFTYIKNVLWRKCNGKRAEVC